MNWPNSSCIDFLLLLARKHHATKKLWLIKSQSLQEHLLQAATLIEEGRYFMDGRASSLISSTSEVTGNGSIKNLTDSLKMMTDGSIQVYSCIFAIPTSSMKEMSRPITLQMKTMMARA